MESNWKHCLRKHDEKNPKISGLDEPLQFSGLQFQKWVFPSMRRGTRLEEYEISQTGTVFTEMENGREGEIE